MVPALLVQIAVIIPARDAERVLPATLAALEGQGAREVIVVDNASRDATAAVALAAGARVVHEPRPSRARARNAGAAAAAGAGAFAFLDADCVPDPGWLRALARCLERAEVAGGRMAVEAPARPSRVERFDAAWRMRQEETIAEQGWSVSANLGVRRATFERVGGFDERFVHAAEDVDLCLRAGGVVFCAGAVARHAPASGLRSVLARGFRHGYGSTQLLHRTGGRIGRRDWRHPRPAVAGPWALERFGLDDPSLRGVARADYAARVAGSAWAELRRAR